MIAVDTSAILAILLAEEEAPECRAEALREPWRQRVVDEELQTEAASGSCRSSTAAAA